MRPESPLPHPAHRWSAEPSDLPRCLVVEDEPDVAHVLTFHLWRHGFGVTVTDTLHAARHALPDLPWQLVVVDIVLPDGDGRDLLPQLRALPHPPIVILTSVLTPYDIPTHDADAFLTKPFRQDDITHALLNAGLATPPAPSTTRTNPR